MMALKTTLKQVKAFDAKDITTASDEVLDKILPHRYAEEVAYSIGM